MMPTVSRGVRSLLLLLLLFITTYTHACSRLSSGGRSSTQVFKRRSSVTPVERLFEVQENVIHLVSQLNDGEDQNKIKDLSIMLQLLDRSSQQESPGSADPDRMFSEKKMRCNGCRFGVKTVFAFIRKGGPKELLQKFAETMCYLFVYRNKFICKGIIEREVDPLVYIVTNSAVTASQFCALILSALYDDSCGLYRGPRWSLTLPPPHTGGYNKKKRRRRRRHTVAIPDQTSLVIGRTAFDSELRLNTTDANNLITHFPFDERGGQEEVVVVPSSSAVANAPPVPAIAQERSLLLNNNFVPRFNNGKPFYKVLHITDIHFDPSYEEGTAAVCEAPICCVREAGTASSAHMAAGKWGDYRHCDSPRILIENMLHYITTHHKDIDYIMFTGDNVPHDIWRISRRHNLVISDDVTHMLQRYFPNTPVYSSVGNHEAFPRDSFPPPEVPGAWKRFGNQWLYDNLVDQWQTLSPHQHIPNSARYAGCYSMPVAPGFRIISINTSFCYKWNWWILLKSTDPGRVLRWLVHELLQSESRGEYVHIIGHMAPHYVECFEQWRHQYSRLVTRFSHIIRGQFFGHCHRDDLKLQYDVRDPNLAIGVQYLTPNNGPFSELNPSFRLYYVDGDHKDSTRAVLDYETYYTNLTAANFYGRPHWELLYRAKRDLGLKSLEAPEWDNFMRRLAVDNSLFKKYFRYHVQASDPLLKKGCNFKCKKKLLCAAVDSDVYLPKKCVED